MLAKREAGWHGLDGMLASRAQLSRFDFGEISAAALLFQSGYLTVLGREEADGERFYRLGYPNREVRESLNRALLDGVLRSGEARLIERNRIRRFLRDGDLGDSASIWGLCCRGYRTSGTVAILWDATRGGTRAYGTRISRR